MKETIQQFKETLLEEIDQLEEMKKYSQHIRDNLFGIIMQDENIKDKIDNNHNRINELNQLLTMLMLGDLDYIDISEIRERFEYVRNNIKHKLRVDKKL